MLNESLRIMYGTIKETIQNRKERKLLEQRQQQYVKDIIRGKFPKLTIDEEETAEIIIKWCDQEEKPVEFFLKQLSVVGIVAPVEIANLVEEKEKYSFVLREYKNDKLWTLHLSKLPKEYLIKEVKIDESVFYALKKIPYIVLGRDIHETILGINKGGIDFKYCRREQIKICIGKQAEIKIDEIEWKNYDLLELYPKAMNLIKEIILLDKNLEPYNYYMAIKQIIQKYYDVKGAEFIFTMPFFTISRTIDIAEAAIKEVEELEY